mmetsp:Transcript_64509/g.162328  ORF Transcript_64509/g.162328 Transcript_64509/m.162328 type:complete len:559 (-) Transcript_64509:22-1698(-)
MVLRQHAFYPQTDEEEAGQGEDQDLIGPTSVRDLLRLHVEGDEYSWTPARRLGRLSGTAVVAATCLLAVLATSAALVARRGRATVPEQVGPVALSENLGPDGELAKEGYHWEWVCGDVDFRLESTVHTNLGGLGPDDGDEGIVYLVAELKDGEWTRDIKLKVNAKSSYNASTASKNGMTRDFGGIRLNSDGEVDLQFSLWDLDDSPLTLDTFHMSWYDLDHAPQGGAKEYVVAQGAERVNLTTGSIVHREDLEDGGVKLEATVYGTIADNPKSSADLTDMQKKKTAVLKYRSVHSFDMTLGIYKGQGAPRNFIFAPHDAFSCKLMEIEDPVTEWKCSTIDHTLVKVLHSNLGGQGPDDADRHILYRMAEWKDGIFVRHIRLMVTATSKYRCGSGGKNGMSKGGFGSIRVDGGSEVHLKFQFYDELMEPLTLETFRISWYDLDHASTGNAREFVMTHSIQRVDVVGDSNVYHESDTNNETTSVYLEAGVHGTSSDNPENSVELNEAQKEKSAALEFKDVHTFTTVIGVINGRNPRNFNFAPHSFASCEQVAGVVFDATA